MRMKETECTKMVRCLLQIYMLVYNVGKIYGPGSRVLFMGQIYDGITILTESCSLLCGHEVYALSLCGIKILKLSP